jgi:outer membrane protein TolC
MTRRSLLLSLLVLAAPLGAQPTRQLSLEDAVRLAQERSEGVTIARAGVTRARGQLMQARSRFLPQLDGSVAYTKTLKSQFEALGGGGGGDSTGGAGPQSLCAPRIPENATPDQRAAALAQASTCQGGGGLGGIDFSRVGFGARNQWAAGLQLSQPLFTGGRVSAGFRAAQSGQRAAELELAQQRAQTALEVTQAYYDAALADRMVAIADSTLEQTEDVLRQTTVARRVGNQSEFELLRAQVARDNQRPVAIQARAQREVAYLRLKQLLDVPLDEAMTLSTAIEDAASPSAIPAVLAAARLTSPAAATTPASLDTAVAERAIVRQTGEAVRAQEQLLRVARGQRLPSIALTSGYQRLFFPSSTFPTLSEYAQNWTVGVSAGISLFNGGRVKGEELVARADLDESRARLRQVQELAALDARVALNALAQAEAAWGASQGTVEQAQRAYRIDQIRFREGIATQTDLSQTRILLQQATANRALAARELAVARMTLALLRDLPLQLGRSPSGTINAGAMQGAGAAAGSSPAPQQPRIQQAASGQSASSATVGGAP